ITKQKVCLAYSGGLETSCIIKYLLASSYKIITFMTNIGQEEDFGAVRAKALKIGASKVYI
ncbi:hypothetical protein OIDMADRAFT_137636, partial [Oidiodendron maius Zn]